MGQLIEQANHNLEKRTSNFIQARLNRKIKETLGGKSADNLKSILA